MVQDVRDVNRSFQNASEARMPIRPRVGADHGLTWADVVVVLEKIT